MKEYREIVVDSNIKLKKYYSYYKKTIEWYQNPELCKQVDNIDFVYDMDRLKKMYKYLNTHGECYYIYFKEKNRFRIIGDATIFYDHDIAIVIDPNYQNKHIGRKIIKALINRAKELNYNYVSATIYNFNLQSQKSFLAAGFKKEENDKYIYRIE